MAEPQRIVSLVPSHTETLHDLGLARRMVGRTRFCIHPEPWVSSLAVVGGTKDAKLETILALKPDLVVADKDENPKALVEAIEAAGVEVLWSAIETVEQVADFVVRLAARCGGPAPTLAAAWQSRLATTRASIPRREPIPVFCPIWFNPWMSFNSTAYPSAMLAEAGFANVFGARPGTKYFEVPEVDVAASSARWTLLPTEPYPFHKQRGKVATAGLGDSGRPARVRILDGEALTWFGVRTLPGLLELARVADEMRQEEEKERSSPKSVR